jgi:Mn2+/Fe2+ NRAMP family transporter
VIGVLVAASVIGGLGTPFSLILLVLLARDRTIMGADPISTRLAIAGWLVTILTGGFGLFFLTAAALGKL